MRLDKTADLMHHSYGVKLLKFAHSKSAENESCQPVLLSVTFENSTHKVKLSLADIRSEEYIIKSLRIKYEFSNMKIAKDLIECIEESKCFVFSFEAIDRHILHGGFKCEINYQKGDQIFLALYHFEIPYFSHKKAIRLCQLGTFFPSENTIRIYNQDLKEDSNLSSQDLELLSMIKEKKLSNSDRLKKALNIEDLTQQAEFSKHTLIDVNLEQTSRGQLKFTVEREKLPEKIEQTSLCLIPMKKFNTKKFMFNKEEDCSFVLIDKIVGNTILFSRKKLQVWNPKLPFDINISYAIRFVPNRITIRASINALEFIEIKKLSTYFDKFEEIPVKTNLVRFDDEIYKDSDFVWCNKNIESNEEQKLAIKNIVNCTAFPFPYCVFGPPGTGKTSCVVECILQILRLKPKLKILVATQSNSASNEIGERLLKYTSINKIFRLYSSRMQKINPGGISENLVRTSNLRSLKESEFPSREELKYFPIIISTLTTSSQLVRSSLQNHFDYIFIDECAATNEPEACIPIVGLGCQQEEITANIILIGDHLQLRPVITSTFARDHLELDVSLMERVITTRKYQKNPKYDSKYVTQFLNNYRSHPSILHFSNVEFYESTLKAKNTNEEVYLGTKWNALPNKQFPIIFCCEKSASAKEDGGTSSFNEGEIKIVRNYVDHLLSNGIGDRIVTESDIGVITPYKAQLQKLRKILPPKVEIGTSEYYQGREKLIIIISTVKSKTGVGFLRDPRRLNVCLTRAKALMIVVGNGDTLQQDEIWKRFIHYCKQNNSCVGSNFWLRSLKEKFEIPVEVKSPLKEKPQTLVDEKSPLKEMAESLSDMNSPECTVL